MADFTINRRGLLAAGGMAVGTAVLGAGAIAANKISSPTPTPDFKNRIPVAFVMGDGSTMIDFAGPWEVFQDVSDKVPGFYLYTVSDDTSEISTEGNPDLDGKAQGLKFRSDFSFDQAPQPRVIVMGAQSGHTPAKIAWIRQAAAQADYVLSVCTGAFLLAKTGLLDGLEATTHHNFFDSFEKQFPKVKLVRDARYVDNGKFMSAGGLTSGVDGALHVVDRIYGRAIARELVQYLEYAGTGWETRARS